MIKLIMLHVMIFRELIRLSEQLVLKIGKGTCKKTTSGLTIINNYYYYQQSLLLLQSYGHCCYKRYYTSHCIYVFPI